MTPEKKIIETVRGMLIAKYGYNFLRLSERDQSNLISDEIRKSIQKLRA